MVVPPQHIVQRVAPGERIGASQRTLIEQTLFQLLGRHPEELGNVPGLVGLGAVAGEESLPVVWLFQAGRRFCLEQHELRTNSGGREASR